MKKVKNTAAGAMTALTKTQAQSVLGGVDCPDLRVNTGAMKINDVLMKIHAGSMKI
ncbi:hypothetical protein ACO2Q8_08045 [Larkinella sp. VNQ87]|uniref:hypothetical protein n=1 Tax=Larkinella sp. VNQ87 TaxID=3400921 RepID=UPI003C0A0D32